MPTSGTFSPVSYLKTPVPPAPVGVVEIARVSAVMPPASDRVADEFLMILPVVPLKRVMALFVLEAGPVTSPEPPGPPENRVQ